MLQSTLYKLLNLKSATHFINKTKYKGSISEALTKHCVMWLLQKPTLFILFNYLILAQPIPLSFAHHWVVCLATLPVTSLPVQEYKQIWLWRGGKNSSPLLNGRPFKSIIVLSFASRACCISPEKSDPLCSKPIKTPGHTHFHISGNLCKVVGFCL